MASRLLKRLAWSVLLSGALYFAALAVIGTETAWEHFERIPASALALILLLSLVNYMLRFGRWHWYVRRLEGRVPAGLNLLYYLAGMSLTTTPAKAGEMLRSLYLKNHGFPYTRSIGALLAERAADVVAVLVIACLVLSEFVAYWPWILAALAGSLLLAAGFRVLTARSGRFPEWVGTPLRRIGGRCREFARSASSLFSPAAFSAGIAIGVVSWGAEALAFFLICSHLGLDIGLGLAAGIYALSMLAGAVSFLPGGLGSAEAAMGALLLAAGAEPHTAVTATLVCRVTTLWFGVAVGLSVAGALEGLGRGLLWSRDAAAQT